MLRAWVGVPWISAFAGLSTAGYLWQAQQSDANHQQMDTPQQGHLVPQLATTFAAQLLRTAQADVPPRPKTGALDPQEFKSFRVIEREKLTHNTYRYRFELPNNQVSGLYVASCLVTRAVLPEGGESKAVVRPYTPVSRPDAKGYMDLVIKSYPEGKMSKHIGNLKVGDTLEMKGPIPKYPYQANLKKNIGMVAGGTGVTPMLQVIEEILSNPEDQTKVSLVYGSVSPRDIILKDKLDKLAKEHHHRFKVYYVVDRPGWFGLFWRGGKGYITKDMLRKHLPPPDKDNLIMVCGPPGMMEAISGNKTPQYTQGELTGALKSLGYTSAMVFKF